MDLERDDLQGADDLAVKADERRMEMRRGKIITVSLTVCAVGAGMTVNAYAASTTFEMRKKAVSLLGIITTSNYQAGAAYFDTWQWFNLSNTIFLVLRSVTYC